MSIPASKGFFILITALIVSCGQAPGAAEGSNHTEPQSVDYTPPTQKLKLKRATLPACEYHEVPNPTTYTGPQDHQFTEPGYGMFGDTYYDRGWRAGYEDGLYYQAYYGGITSGSCSCAVKQWVYNMNTGSYSAQPAPYQRKDGESLLGVYSQCNCDLGNSRQMHCLLWNDWGPKSLRLQYQFNENYTGPRTQDQEQYDIGRLHGFTLSISTEPIGLAP